MFDAEVSDGKPARIDARSFSTDGDAILIGRTADGRDVRLLDGAYQAVLDRVDHQEDTWVIRTDSGTYPLAPIAAPST